MVQHRCRKVTTRRLGARDRVPAEGAPLAGLVASGPVAAGALSCTIKPFGVTAPGYWFLGSLTFHLAMDIWGYKVKPAGWGMVPLRRPVVPGRMTRDEATNSTFKDRVPLAGKGASLDEARCPGWRLIHPRKYTNFILSTLAGE